MTIEIEGMQILLAGLWVCVMLTYLLGDVLRIFSGDFAKMSDQMKKMDKQYIWLGISVIMLTPIIMIFLTLVFDQPINRKVNIVAAVFMFLFNIVGLPTYPSWYDRFLIVVGLIFNVITVWYAWNWV